MGDRRLQRIEAIVERQQCMPAEGDDDRLLLDSEHRGLRLLRACRAIGNGVPTLPLGNGLLIDAVATGQRPQARLTMLYRSTDCLCRRGAAVKNLAHSASLHAVENGAPSTPRIKHPSFVYQTPRDVTTTPAAIISKRTIQLSTTFTLLRKSMSA